MVRGNGRERTEEMELRGLGDRLGGGGQEGRSCDLQASSLVCLGVDGTRGGTRRIMRGKTKTVRGKASGLDTW